MTTNKGGRPSRISKKTCSEICDRLSLGESLSAICLDDHMPHRITVMRWLIGEVKGNEGLIAQFRIDYDRAREKWAEHIFEQLFELADSADQVVKTRTTREGTVIKEVDNAGVQAKRLQIDTRKWALARMNPKKYGDVTKVAGSDGGPLEVKVTQFQAPPPKA